MPPARPSVPRGWQDPGDIPMAPGMAGPRSPHGSGNGRTGCPRGSGNSRTQGVPLAWGGGGRGPLEAIPAAHRPCRIPQTPLLCWRLPGAWRIGCSSSSASSPSRRRSRISAAPGRSTRSSSAPKVPPRWVNGGSRGSPCAASEPPGNAGCVPGPGPAHWPPLCPLRSRVTVSPRRAQGREAAGSRAPAPRPRRQSGEHRDLAAEK